MAQPFISTILDMLQAGKLAAGDACRILCDAIAPEVGMGSPSGALRGIGSEFAALLDAYAAGEIDRVIVEESLTRIFALAARREFQAFC
ncbi:MAG: hypothetical protein ACXU8O_07375 [Asticcacaulis sp.]